MPRATVLTTILALLHSAAWVCAADGPGSLIVDGTGYFRQQVQFGLMRLNGDVLRSEGEKLFGKRLPQVQRDVKRLLRDKNYDWSKTDWRDVACYCFMSAQVSDDRDALAAMPGVVPHADWTKPEFDDSGFDRQHFGLPIRQSVGWIVYEQSTLYRRGLYLRTWFDVPDPAKAGDLTLRVTYRGGARVFLNGQEIGRGHLPEGAINSETFATDYPAAAYVAEKDELPERPAWGAFVGDLRCAFEQAPQWKDGQGKNGDFRSTYGNTGVNRKGWQRLMSLRDRTLGPLAVPAKLLRKGPNLLAIELRASRVHPLVVPTGDEMWNARWGTNLSCNPRWDHVRLVGLELRSASAAVPSALGRPPGMQAWAEDMHTRLYDRDFNPAGWPVGVVRFTAAQNGTFSAQIGVGTDSELHGLQAACGDLIGQGGAKIPAAALTAKYLVGHGLDALPPLGTGRCVDHALAGDVAMVVAALYHWADPATGMFPKQAKSGQEREKFLHDFKFFDHITAEAPATVPAGSCQPLWLSLKVPADAPPGKYRGTVTMRADGQTPLVIPVEAEVIGWRVPDPQQFQTFVQSEQSPYGVAKHYKTDLWSDEHFRLIETSFQQLARIGNRWVFVPVVLNSEFGNRDDSMVRWIREQDGSLAFDYSILDRYLGLAQRYQGKPKVLCFGIMHGCGTLSTAVKIYNAATGAAEIVEVGPSQAAARGPLWRAFATSLYAHLKTMHLEDSLYWGHAFDETPDQGLVGLMAEVTPGVGWAAGTHGRVPDATFRAVGRAYGVELQTTSARGWKNPFIHLLVTRYGGSVICVEGPSTPFTYRVMCDRAIHCGFNGLGRVGADYFDWTWFDGCKATQYCISGRANVQTLWPGSSAVESSARNEALLEGVQEAEARTFLEQAVDRNVLPRDLAREVEDVLNNHFLSTVYICAGAQDLASMDVRTDWQARSRRLYQTAAKVAEKIGMDVDRTAFGTVLMAAVAHGEQQSYTAGEPICVPALGRKRLSLKLRNWTGEPRAWQASASAPWIVPEKSAGTVTGQQELGIILDGKTLAAGSEVLGTLVVADAATGTAYPIKIAAKVAKAMEFRVVQEVRYVTGGGAGSSAPHEVTIKTSPVFNPTVGGGETREYSLVNSTSSKQPWKLASSHDWLRLDPTSGELAAESSIPVKIIARPRDRDAASHETTVTLTGAAGAVEEQYTVRTRVLPPYLAPSLPPGEIVYLNDLDPKTLVKSHQEFGFDWKDPKKPWWIGGNNPGGPVYHRCRPFGQNVVAEVFNYKGTYQDAEKYPFTMGKRTYSRGLWVYPHHESVLAIEGAGFTAFAAEVGFFDRFLQNGLANTGALVNFEIHVDGRVRVQSGIMKPSDPPRLLVADNLQRAKEIKLVTRLDDLSSDERCLATWGEPRFVKRK
jgi:hypothetical protein